MQLIRVLIASDNPLSRKGLTTFLEVEDSIDIVGQAGLAELHSGLFDVFLPDVVLIDAINEDSIAALVQDLIIPYILLVENDESRAYKLAEGNVLPHDASLQVYSAALHAAAVGLGVRYIKSRARNEAYPMETNIPVVPLTEREAEVLQLVGQGLTNLAIGRALQIKESTVKFHINGILEKLEAKSRTEAYAIAIRLGMIPL